MANNRMFLVHVPTGLAVGIAKRMSWGWYRSRPTDDIGGRIDKLFEVLETKHYNLEQDNFALAMEEKETAECKYVIDDWVYSGQDRADGLIQLDIAGSENEKDT